MTRVIYHTRQIAAVIFGATAMALAFMASQIGRLADWANPEEQQW